MNLIVLSINAVYSKREIFLVFCISFMLCTLFLAIFPWNVIYVGAPIHWVLSMFFTDSLGIIRVTLILTWLVWTGIFTALHFIAKRLVGWI